MNGKQAKRARAAANRLAAGGEGYRHAVKRAKVAVRDGDEMPTEADRSSVRVPLPNKQWVRSVKYPYLAVCFDPMDSCFGWKMLESEDKSHWQEHGPLSLPEINALLTLPSLADFMPHLRRLRQQSEKVNDAAQATDPA